MAINGSQAGGTVAGQIEQWRQHYFKQAAVVVIVAAIAAVIAFLYIDFWLLLSLVGLGIVIVVYLMLKALQAELQVRAENLILAQPHPFTELSFDDRCGIDVNLLKQAAPGGGINVQERGSVLAGSGFVLEEDLFYEKLTAGAVTLHKTEFEGVVLALRYQGESGNGQFKKRGTRIEFTGSLPARLITPAGRQALIELAEILAAGEAFVYTGSEWLIIWFKTGKRVFYQFKLTGVNLPMMFFKRVSAVVEKINTLDKVLSD